MVTSTRTALSEYCLGQVAISTRYPPGTAGFLQCKPNCKPRIVPILSSSSSQLFSSLVKTRSSPTTLNPSGIEVKFYNQWVIIIELKLVDLISLTAVMWPLCRCAPGSNDADEMLSSKINSYGSVLNALQKRCAPCALNLLNWICISTQYWSGKMSLNLSTRWDGQMIQPTINIEVTPLCILLQSTRYEHEYIINTPLDTWLDGWAMTFIGSCKSEIR